METKNYGKIYLIPSEMGEQDHKRLFPEYNLSIISTLSHYIVENARTSRRMIKKLVPELQISEITFFEYDKHAVIQDFNSMFAPLLEGKNIGIMSEAGLPCIADPGNVFVAKAHEMGVKIHPLVGPNSIIMALISSGFNGQNFTFHGYIPMKDNQVHFIRQIEQVAFKTGQTQIFMETPYRNQKLFEELLQHLKPETKLCIATDITLDDEYIQTKQVKDWKKSIPNIQKRPTIFLIG